MDRRVFLKLASVPVVGIAFGGLAGCNRAPLDIKTLPEESVYPAFLDVIMPPHLEQFAHIRPQVGDALRRLSGQKANVVTTFFKRFKDEFHGQNYHVYGYDLPRIEALFIRLMSHPLHGINANLAMDIIYARISDIPDIAGAVWGRGYSVSYHMCVYWDNYHEPVSERYKQV